MSGFLFQGATKLDFSGLRLTSLPGCLAEVDSLQELCCAANMLTLRGILDNSLASLRVLDASRQADRTIVFRCRSRGAGRTQNRAALLLEEFTLIAGGLLASLTSLLLSEFRGLSQSHQTQIQELFPECEIGRVI
jgi:hypothetical protein